MGWFEGSNGLVSRRGSAPGRDAVVMVVLTEEMLSRGPRMASGAAADVCSWLGIEGFERFPQSVERQLFSSTDAVRA